MLKIFAEHHIVVVFCCCLVESLNPKNIANTFEAY
jgi:hypothetical protein